LCWAYDSCHRTAVDSQFDFIPATYLLPVVRFVGLIWMIATGLLLPRSRAEAQKNRLQYVAA
jgi:hypothetical protein